MKKSDRNRLIGNVTLIVLLFLIGYTMQAQSVNSIYYNMYGKMIISGQVEDSTLMMQTNRLTISLNYKSAEVVIRLDPKTLTKKNEIVKSTESYNSEVLFRGKLGLDYVITEKHPPLDFEVEGYLVKDGRDTRVIGTGHLEHIHGEAYACVLNMDFQVSPQLININWPGKNDIQIKMQTILKKEN